MRRIDAACALGMILREICENVEIATFSNNLVLCPPRRGFALRDVIVQSQPHSSTHLGRAVEDIVKRPFDRLIVITDEQSHDKVPQFPEKRCYMLNVASARNGVGYGAWLHLDGFSESIIRYIQEFENAN
jgi:60 kDa SS-A/Ro ribonucleoprotein